MRLKKLFSFSLLEIIFFCTLFSFSWILMWKTFQVDDLGNLKIATKVWSDFAATVPLIRSFSYGANFPTEYPLFAGPPIRYHFIFYLIVGILEKTGVPLDWALNSLSTIGFFLLTISIYLLGKTVFKSRLVGILSVFLFLFNGSLGFLEYFKKYPLSLNSLSEIINGTSFSSFGPYDGNIVSAFWNLNIFTNQRHLAFSYAIFLFLILFFYKASKKGGRFKPTIFLLVGILVGIMPFFHLAVFAITLTSAVIFFLIYPKIRSKIFVLILTAIVIAAPQFLYMGPSQVKVDLIKFGYLAGGSGTFGFIDYWVKNLGLTLFLFPLGFLMAKKNQRKIFLPFLVFFTLGNIFQFSPEIAANHKFFNLSVIGTNLFTAFYLSNLLKGRVIGRIMFSTLLPLLILTGFIDFFPIVNDSYVTVSDVSNNKTAAFIKESTPSDSVFLNGSFLYDPASLAGRKIYLGWPYFSWSAGYNTDQRFKQMKSILESNDKNFVCQKLKSEGLDFIEIQKPTNLENIQTNYSFFENNFVKIFQEHSQNLIIFNVAKSCKLQ